MTTHKISGGYSYRGYKILKSGNYWRIQNSAGTNLGVRKLKREACSAIDGFLVRPPVIVTEKVEKSKYPVIEANTVKIETCDLGVLVFAAKNANAVKAFRDISGRQWRYKIGANFVPTAGKSALWSILLRFYDGYSITVDGTDRGKISGSWKSTSKATSAPVEPTSKDTPCTDCNKTGKYHFGGSVVNGVYTGKTGTCYRCEGKTFQNASDRIRNSVYDSKYRTVSA